MADKQSARSILGPTCLVLPSLLVRVDDLETLGYLASPWVNHYKQQVKTNYHPASTARMGADGDPMAVLDAKLRVRGWDNLRVCDMSAVPNINAGNTNAPAMMLGSSSQS